MKIKNSFFALFATIAGVILIIILSPLILLALLGAAIDIPGKRKDLRELQNRLWTNWVMRDKYALIAFTEDTMLKEFIKKELLAKHRKNVVGYNLTTQKASDPKFKRDAHIMNLRIIENYDATYDGALALVNTDLTMKSITPVFEEKLDVKATKELFKRELERCIKAWQAEFKEIKKHRKFAMELCRRALAGSLTYEEFQREWPNQPHSHYPSLVREEIEFGIEHMPGYWSKDGVDMESWPEAHEYYDIERHLKTLESLG